MGKRNAHANAAWGRKAGAHSGRKRPVEPFNPEDHMEACPDHGIEACATCHTAHVLAGPLECAFCYRVTMGLVRYAPTQKVHPCCPTCWENMAEAYGAKGEKLWALA